MPRPGSPRGPSSRIHARVATILRIPRYAYLTAFKPHTRAGCNYAGAPTRSRRLAFKPHTRAGCNQHGSLRVRGRNALQAAYTRGLQRRGGRMGRRVLLTLQAAYTRGLQRRYYAAIDYGTVLQAAYTRGLQQPSALYCGPCTDYYVHLNLFECIARSAKRRLTATFSI